MPNLITNVYRPVSIALLGILISMVGAWAAYTNDRIDKQDARISAVEQQTASNTAKLDLIYSLVQQTNEMSQQTLTELREHSRMEARRR